MFDSYDEHGILIKRYGPHFLNTNKYFIIEFLEQYAELFPHDTKLLSFIDGDYEHFDEESHLPSEIISYPQAPGYTRSTEYRKIMYDDSNARGTTVVTEYPLTYDPRSTHANIPYYPVVTEESSRIYQKYLSDVQKYRGLFLCGRLAEFKYYNMDVCIEHALSYFENIKEYLAKCEN